MRKILLILVLSLIINCQAEIRGKPRDDYIREFIPSCTTSTKNSLGNNQISDSTIKSYCSCFATYTADNLTAEQAVKLVEPVSKNIHPDWFKKIMAKGSEYCVKNLSKY